MLMCMCMLTKRTNILFDKATWDKLNKLAKAENTSMGKIIRTAIDERWEREKELEGRKKVIESILKHRPQPFKGRIDYKALINAGRKY